MALYKQLIAAVKLQLTLAWKRAVKETRYNPTKTALATNLSKVPERIVYWKKPIQESNYDPSRSAIVYDQHPTATAPKDAISLPIQEANYDPIKSLMVTTNPFLPTYMKTATVTMTP